MEKDKDQPFRVGQLVEARSFVKGYRGAWFRCKIMEIKEKDGHIGHELRYLDFPDEKKKWIRLYQIPLAEGKKRRDVKREIMVRPLFPPIYRESQMPLGSAILEVIVVTEGTWNVGDLVDWRKDGCHWSGKVSQVLGNDEAMIELMPPPVGEGSSYRASFRDLRPSLDWSPEDGWKLPTLKDGGGYRQCARLVYPVNQSIAAGGRSPVEMPAKGEGATDGKCTGGLSSAGDRTSAAATMPLVASEKLKACGASETLKESENLPKEVTDKQEENIKLVPGDSGYRKRGRSDSTYPSHVGEGSAGIAGLFTGKDLFDSSSPQKMLSTSDGIALNSKRSDTLEAAIMDLEELANKIKWFKSILKHGSPLSNAVKTSWTFVEHRGPSVS